MTKRLKQYDVLRFLAIFLVILIHILSSFRDEALLSNSKSFYFILTCFDSVTRIGVPIFFMISGMFMLSGKKEESYREFFKKRVLKLLIPFVIVSIISYGYNCIAYKSAFNVLEFISLFSVNGISYHFWFMYAIIGIYLLLPFLKKLVQNLSERELRNLIIIIFLGSNAIFFVHSLTTHYFDFATLIEFRFPNLICYINYLFLGYYLNEFHKPSKRDKVFYAIGIISLMLMPILDYSIIEIPKTEAMLVSESALPFLLSMAFLIFFKNNYSKLHIPKFIEDFCSKNVSLVFYIYMLHILVRTILKKFFLSYISPEIAITKLAFIAILFISTTVVTFIIVYLINNCILTVKKKISR